MTRSSDRTLTIQLRGETTTHELAPDTMATIGRSSDCAIQIPDPSVSREHCVAILTDDGLCLNDMRSTHGIVVDDARVDRCVLQPGEHCRLGNAVVTFAAGATVRPEAAAAAPTTAPTAPPSNVSASSQPAPQATVADAPAPAIARIGSYRLLEKIGEGGFGTVYRAVQEPLGREVALKVLKESPTARPADDDDEPRAVDPDRVAALIEEARAAARVADPHLVQVYDVGEADGHHYLSMELVAGGSLARHVRRHGPMQWREVLDLLYDIGSALAAAHRAGIVHRDVKPPNILLASDGSARLADLGMASGTVRGGTVAFMAPEQLRREPVDARTDLYALGVTAYAALTGGAPWQGTRAEIARAQVHEAPPPMHSRNVKAPWHLQQLIVDSLMAKSPADRPQSADELLQRLDELILPGTAPTAEPSGPRGGRRASRQKRLGARLVAEAITVSIVALLVIGTLLALKIGWDVDIYRILGR